MGSLEQRVDEEQEMISLRDAVAQFRHEEGAPINTYDWYRRNAKEGRLSIAGMPIEAMKKGNAWYIRRRKFEEALGNHRNARANLEKASKELAKGIIRQGTVCTKDGGYTNKGDFRLEWNNYEAMRKRSNGTWYCNSCNNPAKTEHNKEECHLCSDWNGCGNDCTLSKVYCPDCKKSMKV